MPYQRERNAIASPSRIAAAGSIRFAIKLSWDGTGYQGFQAQAHGNTIQDEVELRLMKLLRGRSLRILGWGRTDRGVHARGAVVTVDVTNDEVTRLAAARKKIGEDPSSKNALAALSIGSALREFSCVGGIGSITAISVVPVARDFDPRFSCLWKRYIYFISCGSRMRSPFIGRYAWQMDRVMDVDKMVQAAELLSGRHNFQWLSVTQPGEQRDPVRELTLVVEIVDPGPLSVVPAGDGSCTMIKISATCDFFLYRMMRRIVGVLANIGGGRAQLEQLSACIQMFDDGSDRDSDAKLIPMELKETAPAQGLCLDHIEYEMAI